MPCVPYNPDFYLPGVPGSLISTSEGYLGTCARVAGVEDGSRGPLMNKRMREGGVDEVLDEEIRKESAQNRV